MGRKEEIQAKYKAGDTAYGFFVKTMRKKDTGEIIIKCIAPRKGYFMPENKRKKNADLIVDGKNLVDYPVNAFLQCPHGQDCISYNDSVSVESRAYADSKIQATTMYVEMIEQNLAKCKEKHIYVSNYKQVMAEIKKFKRGWD